MKVSFSPNNYTPTGTISFITWSNPALHQALRQTFNESPRERLVEIIIERDGIKAVFEPSNRTSV